MLQVLVLERVEPNANINRYYVLAVEPTLFGDVGLRREWGRIGNRGGASRLELHEDQQCSAGGAWVLAPAQAGEGVFDTAIRRSQKPKNVLISALAHHFKCVAERHMNGTKS